MQCHTGIFIGNKIVLQNNLYLLHIFYFKNNFIDISCRGNVIFKYEFYANNMSPQMTDLDIFVTKLGNYRPVHIPKL